MKKIPTLFMRDHASDHLVRDEVTPGAEWVIAGEGIPTRKFDGSCCLVREGKFFKRYELKGGKVPPDGFEPAQDVDPVTGKQPGWVPVGNGPEDRWHREALAGLVAALGEGVPELDGIYELCGPKVQGNPEGFSAHVLVSLHTNDRAETDFVMAGEPPREYAGLCAYLSSGYIEGIVWHHPDGRMVKIKTKDFSHKRARLP